MATEQEIKKFTRSLRNEYGVAQFEKDGMLKYKFVGSGGSTAFYNIREIAEGFLSGGEWRGVNFKDFVPTSLGGTGKWTEVNKGSATEKKMIAEALPYYLQVTPQQLAQERAINIINSGKTSNISQKTYDIAQGYYNEKAVKDMQQAQLNLVNYQVQKTAGTKMSVTPSELITEITKVLPNTFAPAVVQEATQQRAIETQQGGIGLPLLLIGGLVVGAMLLK